MRASDPAPDVLIIGGGITGCATAYYLAKAGARVTLLEKDTIGFQASSRNQGAVREQMRDPAELPMVREALRRWRHLDDELGMPTEYRTTGNLMVTYREEEVEGLEEEAERQRGMGLEMRLVRGADLRELVPGISEEVLAGMYSSGDGHANPPLATLAFATAARRAGAAIRNGVRVTSIDVESGRVRGVQTPLGSYAAEKVLCAAGVHSRDLCRPLGLELAIAPWRQQALITSRIPQRVTNAYLRCTGPRIGFMQTLSGHGVCVLGPAENVGLQTSLTSAFVANATRELLRLVPAVDGIDALRVWSGWYEVTPDDLPLIGPAPGIEGLVVAAGTCGHGFAFGPALGMMLSELLLKGASPISMEAFRLSRFSEPGYRKPEAGGKLAALQSLTKKVSD